MCIPSKTANIAQVCVCVCVCEWECTTAGHQRLSTTTPTDSVRQRDCRQWQLQLQQSSETAAAAVAASKQANWQRKREGECEWVGNQCNTAISWFLSTGYCWTQAYFAAYKQGKTVEHHKTHTLALTHSQSLNVYNRWHWSCCHCYQNSSLHLFPISIPCYLFNFTTSTCFNHC